MTSTYFFFRPGDGVDLFPLFLPVKAEVFAMMMCERFETYTNDCGQLQAEKEKSLGHGDWVVKYN